MTSASTSRSLSKPGKRSRMANEFFFASVPQWRIRVTSGPQSEPTSSGSRQSRNQIQGIGADGRAAKTSAAAAAAKNGHEGKRQWSRKTYGGLQQSLSGQHSAGNPKTCSRSSRLRNAWMQSESESQLPECSTEKQIVLNVSGNAGLNRLPVAVQQLGLEAVHGPMKMLVWQLATRC